MVASVLTHYAARRECWRETLWYKLIEQIAEIRHTVHLASRGLNITTVLPASVAAAVIFFAASSPACLLEVSVE